VTVFNIFLNSVYAQRDGTNQTRLSLFDNNLLRKILVTAGGNNRRLEKIA
jgi:hypothetical protein